MARRGRDRRPETGRRKTQSLTKAGPKSITFFAADGSLNDLKKTAATAVLIGSQWRDQIASAGLGRLPRGRQS